MSLCKKTRKRVTDRIKNARARSRTAQKVEEVRTGVVYDEINQFNPYVIYIEGRITKDNDGLTAKCTCGWNFGPIRSLVKIGNAAGKHAGETGHLLRRHL